MLNTVKLKKYNNWIIFEKTMEDLHIYTSIQIF